MQGKLTVFEALMKYVPKKKFDEFTEKHEGNKWCKNFFCWDLLTMLLHGQLSGATSMRMLELTNSCQAKYLKCMGANIAPLSTLSDACRERNPLVFMEVFSYLLALLKKTTSMEKELKAFINLIDSTPIQLKGHGYDWAKNNYRITGLKVHTVYDPALESPIHFTITPPNVNDITEAKKIDMGSNGIYVFDKGYYDFSWWADMISKGNDFVTRIKSSTPFKILRRNPVQAENLLHDWVIQLTSQKSKCYKGLLRHIRVKLKNNKTIGVITNNLEISAERIAELYKLRWEIELFFKCLKQNLKIKRFWGQNENAVKLQIITSMIAYILLRLAQVKADCAKLSIMQVRIIIRIKLYEPITIGNILKIPDKKISTRLESKS